MDIIAGEAAKIAASLGKFVHDLLILFLVFLPNSTRIAFHTTS